MTTVPVSIASLLVLRLWGTLALADGGVAPAAVPAPPAHPPSSLLMAPVVQTPTSGEPPAPQYRLERAKDGSGDLLYAAAGFSARVTRDGSVVFSNKHVSALNFVPVFPAQPSSNVPSLESVIRRRGKKAPKAPPPDPIADETRYPSTTFSRFRPDPREACQYPRSCFFEAAAVLVGPGGKADLTDTVMRLHRQDPYRYEKARFLTATREMRIRMAGRAHAEDIQRSAVELPQRLDDIVCDQRLTVGERRGIIQALRAELDSSTDADQFSAAIAGALQRLSNTDGGVDVDRPARCAPTSARSAHADGGT